jgi:hypothetical protein
MDRWKALGIALCALSCAVTITIIAGIVVIVAKLATL